MTKYVIQSGGLKTHPQAARKYFAELLKGLGTKPKLLWCFFATLPDDPEIRFVKYPQMYERKYPEGVKPVHKNAQIETFEEQVKESDAIYIHGGEMEPLYDVLKNYDLKTLFDGKSVGTNSASSMILAQNTWSCSSRKVTDGLDIFPFKFIAHYKSHYGSDDPRGPIDWQRAYDELAAYGDTSLPIHALEEGEFIVMEK